MTCDVMLRYGPCGDTSKAATVVVMTRGVSLLTESKKNIFFQISSETTRVVTATVAAFDISPQGLSRNIKYRSTAKFVYMGHGDR